MRDFLIWMAAATIATAVTAYDPHTALDAAEFVQTTALVYLTVHTMPSRKKETTDA